MTKINFVKSMEYLAAYYVNFKIDLNNQLTQRIWFNSLKHLDDTMIEALVNDYCSKNEFAPASPTHLLNHLKNAYKAKERSSDEAFAILLEIRSNPKNRGYNPVCGGYVNFDKLIVALESTPAIKTVALQMKIDLEHDITENNITWVKKRFVELYNEAIEQQLQPLYLPTEAQLKLELKED